MNNHPSQPGRRGHGQAVKEQSWRDILGQFAAGGQRVREFCAARQIKESAFYFWRREIARRDEGVAGKGPAGRDASTAGPTASRPLAFAQILVRPPQPTAAQQSLRLCLSGGRELLLPISLPAQQVAAIVRAIEEAP
jgi:hypothetical protein